MTKDQLVFKHKNGLSFVLDEEAKVVFTNPSILQQLGHPDVSHKTLVDYIPYGERDEFERLLKKCAQQPKEVFSVTFSLIAADGTISKPCTWEVVALPYGNSGVQYFGTSLNPAHTEALEMRSRLDAMINSTSDINMLLAPDLEILSFNDEAKNSIKDLYGRSLKIGENFDQFIVEGTKENFYGHVKRALSGMRSEEIVQISFPTNQKIWFHSKYFPAYDANGEIIGVSFNSSNIDRQQRMLNALTDVAHHHSHQIRRPVATILGLFQLIKIDQLTAENRSWFEHMRTATQELDAVIHQIVQETANLEYYE